MRAQSDLQRALARWEGEGGLVLAEIETPRPRSDRQRSRGLESPNRARVHHPRSRPSEERRR